ncbi:MAG TPA: cation transporter, partial [Acidimicrobiia bacterium]|nr:cation transporter [Acidimicrobiia bacterium]
ASTAGVWIGLAQHSVALLAFGAVGILDAAGSLTLVVHFSLAQTGHHRADHVERVAAGVITVGLVAVGAATVVGSVTRLVERHGGRASWSAIALAAASLGTLTALALRKRWVARALPSHALLADSHLSALGAVLAAVTLGGVVATRTLGWWWADPTAAIAIGLAAGGVAVSLARAAAAEADESRAAAHGPDQRGR